MSFDIKAFNKGVDALLKLLAGPVQQLEAVAARGRNTEYEEDVDFTEMQVRDYTESLRIRIHMALESLGHVQVAAAFGQEFERRFSENVTATEMLPIVGVMTVPALDYLKKYHGIINELYGTRPALDEIVVKRNLLADILQSTGKIVSDRKLDPANEAEVKQVIYETLTHVFNDTTREMPIAKATKAYKPDIGVIGLRTAVEYKYADTEKKAKTLLGGIYEDLHGYKGSRDWTHFFAVLYMTDNFFSPVQITNELKLSRLGKRWKLFLVTGGKRGRGTPRKLK